MISKVVIYIIICVVMIYSATIVKGLPARYCLYPINRTDCGRPPTPVFSYYKPGSRCEIEIWRGCPSYNRFESEATCSHFCIGKLRYEDEGIEKNEISTDSEHIDSESCEGIINRGDCGSKAISVFTYNKTTEACEKAEWRGCRTRNKFSSETKCMDLCITLNVTVWKAEMENITTKEAEEANKVLDEILETPVAILETSLKNLETPVKTLETSVEILETPVKILETSVEILETPIEILETPVEEHDASAEDSSEELKHHIEHLKHISVPEVEGVMRNAKV